MAVENLNAGGFMLSIRGGSLLLSVVLLPCCGVMAAETEIKPTDGLNHVGEKVRVRFQVSNIGAAAKGAEWVVGFRTWKDDGCLIVRVPADVKADFAAQNINSPHHFLNKDVEVTGQIQVISPGGRDCPAIFLKSNRRTWGVEAGAG